MKRLLLSAFWIATASGQALAQSAFTTEAPHAVILDAATGEVLFEKDARAPMAPASMTKIMTAQMVFEALEAGEITPETMFRVSEDAWRRGGVKSGSSTMFLDVKSEVSVADLMKGVIIQSGNDACITLAEGISGSEEVFAQRMTDKARAMGLSSATFLNATGWPDAGHEISALDLAKLAQRQIVDYPQYYSIYAEPDFTWNGIKQSNRNPLLGRVNGADGLKTGHTEVSGYGLVGSAKRGEDRRIIVINGLDSQSARRDVSTRLMDAAFRQFRIYDLHPAGTELARADVYMGKAGSVGVSLAAPLRAGMHVSDRKGVASKITYAPVSAPVSRGDVIGQLTLSVPGRDAASYDIIATEDVKRRGVLSRAWAGLLANIRG